MRVKIARGIKILSGQYLGGIRIRSTIKYGSGIAARVTKRFVNRGFHIWENTEMVAQRKATRLSGISIFLMICRENT